MAKLALFMAGCLLLAESQARDVADTSTPQGFLSNSFSKFVLPAASTVKHGEIAAQNMARVQDSMPAISTKEEEKAVQKLLVNGNNNMPIALSAFGVALLTLATMLGARIRRGLQPATAVAGSDALLSMEMKAQGSQSSRQVGWGQPSSQNARPPTLCYAEAGQGAVERKEALAAQQSKMSRSLPFLMAPKGLAGYIGEEAGFDPLGFAEIYDIKWMREAEIKHGRVAMLATIGYTYPEAPWFIQAFPGDAYSHSNPIKAALAVPPEAWAQVVLFCGVMEWSLNNGKMTMLTMFEGSSRKPGDLGWDPMGLMNPANEDRMKMRELQHGRLAMIAIGGMIHGSFVTGTGVFGGAN
jgi:hypothetical protein